MTEEAKRTDHLTGISELFGYRVHDKNELPEIDGKLVTFYIEDDGWWHAKFTIHQKWIPDLQRIASLAKQATK